MTIAEEFFVWIAEQPPERDIDHCGGWQNCAVGEFLEEKFNGVYLPDVCYQQTPEAEELLYELETEHGYIYESLNHGRAPHDDSPDIDTYGGLADLIETYKDRGADLFLAHDSIYTYCTL
jgi:hypothetical protein